MESRLTKILTSSRIAKDEASSVQILPNNQGLNSTELERLESVGDTEAVFACILADVIEIRLDQFLLPDKLDISQRFCSQVNSLDGRTRLILMIEKRGGGWLHPLD
jgi:hypothetical protein